MEALELCILGLCLDIPFCIVPKALGVLQILGCGIRGSIAYQHHREDHIRFNIELILYFNTDYD
jgi:hypothetical protein